MSDNNNSGGENDMILFLLFFAFLGVVLYFVWINFTAEITHGLRHIRLVQMEATEVFVDEGYGVQYPDMRDPVFLQSMKEFFQEADAENISRRHLAVATDVTLRPLRIPIAIIIILMAIYIYFKGPHTKFKEKLTLQKLIERQSKAFPYIAPFIDFDPTKVPNRAPGDPVPEELPLFAEALGPEEWLAHNFITMDGKEIDVDQTKKAFAKQLGKRWTGWQKQPDWIQVLIAAYAMRAARKRQDSDDLLGRLSMCWHHKSGLKLSRQRGVLGDARKFLKSKAAEPTLKAMRQHAYQTTAVMRALDFARSQGGVCSPGQFVWLRGHDRNLWYALNNLGRQAYHPEALGSMAHFKLEKLTQRPVPKPKMDLALKSLQEYMRDDHARPVPQVAYKKKKDAKRDKKSGIMKPVGA